MKISTVIKIIFLLLLITLGAIFFLQNRMPVEVALPFERGFRFGLIYLLLISYLLGVLTMAGAVVWIRGKIRKKKKNQDEEEAQELLDEEE